ncbi:phage head closure protein [Rhodobacter capsulatus]|uniref:phage head closure protein n=1 Tax=Rhodobacter capsulatus TaxID=1061 RepID=UPI004026FE37
MGEQLDTRVTILRPQIGDDGLSRTLTGWEEHATLWASFGETPGAESAAAGQIETRRGARLRLRASRLARQITAADRVRARGQLWDIRGICAPDAGRGLIELSLAAIMIGKAAG